MIAHTAEYQQPTHPSPEGFPLFKSQGVCFSNNWNNVHTLIKPLHELHIDRFQPGNQEFQFSTAFPAYFLLCEPTVLVPTVHHPIQISPKCTVSVTCSSNEVQTAVDQEFQISTLRFPAYFLLCESTRTSITQSKSALSVCTVHVACSGDEVQTAVDQEFQFSTVFPTYFWLAPTPPNKVSPKHTVPVTCRSDEVQTAVNAAVGNPRFPIDAGLFFQVFFILFIDGLKDRFPAGIQDTWKMSAVVGNLKIEKNKITTVHRTC